MTTKKDQATINAMIRTIFEGGKPTLKRLAIVSSQLEEELRALADAEGWTEASPASVIRRRIHALSDKVIGLLEDGEQESLLEKSRLEGVTTILRAIEKLKDVARSAESDDDTEQTAQASDIKTAFTKIDRRIIALATSYAKKLVAEKSDSAPSAPKRN